VLLSLHPLSNEELLPSLLIGCVARLQVLQPG